MRLLPSRAYTVAEMIESRGKKRKSAMNQFNSIKANQIASRLYHRAHARALLGKAGSALVGRSRRLLNLSDVRAACRVRSQHYAGIRAVPIHQIRGSEPSDGRGKGVALCRCRPRIQQDGSGSQYDDETRRKGTGHGGSSFHREDLEAHGDGG